MNAASSMLLTDAVGHETRYSSADTSGSLGGTRAALPACPTGIRRAVPWPLYQPQLAGCQTGLNNMGVTDLSAGDLMRNREVAPSHGFGAPACFGAACTSTAPSPTPPMVTSR